MINDLNQWDGPGAIDAQVCIIGGGTAGIFLAARLRRQGLRPVILEAGDAVARAPEECDQRCEQRGIRYRGAESGRSFGLGGTSVLWGGQLIPVVPSDMDSRPAVGFDAWPVSYDEVASYFPVVAEELGLARPLEDSDGRAAELSKKHFSALCGLSEDFEVRLSEWLPFEKRNFAQAFTQLLKSDDVTVWLNAPVVELVRSAERGGRISSISARSPTGRTLTVRPEVVVVAAGALESTRLLLAFDEATGHAITATGAPLGRFFSDHLSVTCGRFTCCDWRQFNLAVAPIFVERGIMRTPRLELAPQTQKTLGLTSAFAHFTFVTSGDTGFDVIRSFLRRRQGEQQRLGLTPARIGRAGLDLSAMAFWRGVYRRLWIPRQADLLLQVDIEQVPNADSRLYLSDERDAVGRKRLVIDWRITPDDVRVVRAVTKLTIDAWQKSSLRQFAELHLSLPDAFDSFETLYDVYHPTGVLRMGSSEASSVVDRDLKLWAADNCYVTSTAVFPSAGSVNPGMTHLALTTRLANHLAKVCGG